MRHAILVAALAVSAPGLSSGQLRAAPKAATPAPKAGSSFKDCRNCPEMLVIPAGAFMMGSPASEPGRRDNEPQSMGTIARAFAVSKTEVTWDQWEACVRGRGCDGLAVENALRLKNDGTPNHDFVDWGCGTRPVVGVSWYDAQAYVGWLNEKTGLDVWLDQTAPVCSELDRAHQPADGSANRQGSCRTRMFRSGSFVSNPDMHRSAKRTADLKVRLYVRSCGSLDPPQIPAYQE